MMARKGPRDVRAMFEGLVARYDLMNRLMTLGRDRRWREEAAAMARPQGAVALDVGTGTGELALALRRRGAALVVGIDFSPAMLARARAKAGQGLALALADALHLPFADGTFDRVTCAFVLRNLSDVAAGLREMARVLRPGGLMVSLELVRPTTAWGRRAMQAYGRLLPLLGGLVAGDAAAYRYLPRSAQGFLAAGELARVMEGAGLRVQAVRSMALGTVALHVARRP